MTVCTILLSTIDDRIAGVAACLMRPLPHVRYVVSWQQTHGPQTCPQELAEREDVVVVTLDGRGLSRNRNNALRHAPEDGILLIADDDERFSPEGIRLMINYYDAHPEVDILLVRLDDENGRPLKTYPTESFAYHGETDAYYATSHEISMRADAVVRHGLWFDERFGLGADPLASGEETILLHDALRLGMTIRWEPINIGSTRGETTGLRFLADKAVQRSKGAVWGYTEGPIRGRLRTVREALYHTVHNAVSPFPLITQMWRGISYITSTKAPVPKPRDVDEAMAVTIVVPFRDRARLMVRMLESLRRVDYPQLNVILVDNGSENEARQLCESFAATAPFPVRIVDEARPGAARARNRGLKECTTPFVYFFDSDDELSSDFLVEVMPRMRGADVGFIPVRQEVDGKVATRRFVLRDEPATALLSAMWNTVSTLWRTDYLRRIGGWADELTFWDDWELGIRAMVHQPRVAWVTDRAYHRIYVHAESITGQDYAARTDRMESTLRAVLALALAADMGTKASRRLLDALYLRTMIIEGTLRREHHPLDMWTRITASTAADHPSPTPEQLGNKVHTSTYKPSPVLAYYGRGLRSYVALGGRGAWRIALMILDRLG